jgi:hypothetical protein
MLRLRRAAAQPDPLDSIANTTDVGRLGGVGTQRISVWSLLCTGRDRQ